MTDMDIKLEKIDTSSSIDGLEVLNSMATDPDVFGEAPIDDIIDEELYSAYLMVSEEELELGSNNPCYRYWVVLEDIKIGYADVRSIDNDNGNIGLVLLKEYRNKGLGKIVLPMLIDKAYEHGLDDIVISTSKDNVRVRKICDSICTYMTDTDEQNKYIIKSKKKIHKL